VGVTTGVGKAVGVVVGGNHTTVEVTVGDGGISVSVGVGAIVVAALHALHKIPIRNKNQKFFISIFIARQRVFV
jgi:hypothetical protein